MEHESQLSPVGRVIRADRLSALRQARWLHPEAFAEAVARRRRWTRPTDGRVFIIAADHAARGSLAAGHMASAMGDRYEFLNRLALALGRPGVDGVLGTPDVIEDLTWLGLLEGKAVVGSVNRAGLHDAAFAIDDRVSAYDIAAITRHRLDFAKLLVRIDLADAATAGALERAAATVSAAATAHIPIMLEVFMSRRVGGKLRNDLSTDAVVMSVSIATGLGNSSAWTWLKLPVVEDMPRVLRATTLPTLLLGGDSAADPQATYQRWAAALALPGVRGMVAGRSMLYPADGNVVKAVDTAAQLVHGK